MTEDSCIVEVNKISGGSEVLKLIDKKGRRYFFELSKVDVRDGKDGESLDLFHNDGVQSDFTFAPKELKEKVITIWLDTKYCVEKVKNMV